MLITEMTAKLEEIKSKHGDISVLLTTSYSHHNVKWIDYSEAQETLREHVCIRLVDQPIID